MLRALRNQTQSIFFKCFLVLLICGFALWGVGDLTGGSQGKSVLSVKNQNISIEEALNEINRARYMLPERLSLEEAIKNGVHKSVLNKLEQEILINEEANFLDLNVPLSEQMRLIKEEKAFKDALGNFSQNKFLNSLKNGGLSEEKYLDMIKTESNFKQLSMPIMNNEYYNEKIINKIINWQNEVRDIEYETFKIINKNEINKPSNVVLKSFYEKNKKTFEIPLTRDVKYIELTPSDFEEKVVINKKQLDEQYEIEKLNYVKDETREILQITTQDENRGREFVDLIKKGKDFIELAKNNFKLNKLDVNIGFLKISDLPLESADLVFNAQLNDIIGPIKTKFGFSIYKVINISPAEQPKYEDIIEDIKKKIIKEKSVEILFEKLDEIEDLIAEGNNIEEIVNSNIFTKKIATRNLQKISKQGFIYSYDRDTSFLNKNPEFIKNIWNTKVKELSEIFNSNNDNYYILEIINEKNSETPAFDLVKNKITDQWLKKELIIKTKEKVKGILKSKNNNLLSKSSLKRDDKNLENIKDQFLINKIFEIDNKEVNLFVSAKNLIAVKVIKTRTNKYKFNKKNFNDLNESFSKSFFNDISNFYIQHLAFKHKLQKNYEEFENYINIQQENIIN